MASKGAKAVLEPRARRLYAEGRTLDEIARELSVSVPTLSRWKNETRDPKTGVDEWDRGREQKASNLQRLSDLFEEQLNFMEGLQPVDRTPPMLDTLSKLGSLVRTWSAMAGPAEVDLPAIFLRHIEWLAGKLKARDPEGLKVLARNFDELIEQYKAEHAQTA